MIFSTLSCTFIQINGLFYTFNSLTVNKCILKGKIISKKATKSELLERELEIQRLIALGVTGRPLFESVAKTFKIATSTVKNQYYQILKELSAQVKEGRSELRANLMARNEHIYRQSLNDKKYKIALDANMAQAKLGGLFETENTENEAPKTITISEADNSGLKLVGEGE